MRIVGRIIPVSGLLCVLMTVSIMAQSENPAAPAPRSLPPPLPALPPGSARSLGTNTADHQRPGLVPISRFGSTSAPVTQVQPVQSLKPLPLVWDAEVKEYQAKPGETNAQFTFRLTNTTDEAVVINQVHTSCGCTVAHLPATPWTVVPGTNGEIEVTVDLRGKHGLVIKTITVYPAAYATKQLTVKVNIPDSLAGVMGGDRSRNQQIATADRQAVFRGDCAACHAAPAAGKKGAELYVAVCGVCHQAEHRASMVPDLANLNHSTDRIYWKVWAAQGKAGSLMPGFSKTQGGPLDDDQLESLADYLADHIPSRPAAAAAPQSK